LNEEKIVKNNSVTYPKHEQLVRFLYVCLSVALLCAPVTGSATEGRTLGGYRFIPSTDIRDPFITTHFGNATGVAFSSSVETPLLILDVTPPDTLVGYTGSLLFILLQFEYQHAVHPRVTVRVAGEGASRIGTSGQSILTQGVSALVGGDIGTTVVLWENERVLLSGLADLGFGRGLVISLQEFYETAIAVGVENASIITTENVGRVSGGAAAAWAPQTWMGTTGVLEIGYSSAGDRKSELLWKLGASGSVDFSQRGGTPVGLQLTAQADRMTQTTADTDGTAYFVGLGVFYTGREDFNIGLETVWGNMPLSGRDVSINPTTFRVALRYYF